MKAYLIDPWTRTVTEVERSEGSAEVQLHEIYRLIGCQHIEAVNPSDSGSDVIYVDEEGLFKDGQLFFYCRLWPVEALAGRGLWVGTTRSGDDTSPGMTRQYVEDQIVWSI